MAIQVAVRQRAELFQFSEGQSLGMGNQGGEHAQARALMNHSIEPTVGKSGGRLRFGAIFLQLYPGSKTAGPRQPLTDRARMVYPLPTEKGTFERFRSPNKPVPRRDTRRPRRTFGGEESGTRRRCLS